VPLRRFFLHQAVLSGVLLAATTESERRWLPLDHGYPLNLHERIPEAKRARSLDGIPCLIIDTFWLQRGDWQPPIDASAFVRAFLEKAWARTYEVVPGLLRQEGRSNAYLLRTGAGDVVIDPGGSPEKDGALRRLHGDRPLLAVLLTHGHADHREGIANWTDGRDVPVVAQRRYAELLAEQDAIAPLLARRNGIIAGKPIPSPSSEPGHTPVETTVSFDERHVMELGGMRVEMIHAPSETPDTAIVWVPSLRAAFVADMFFSSFPNLSTPRGGRTRSALEYARALDAALALEPELLLPGHEEPIFGREAVRRRLERYRDATLWVHEAVMRGIREGTDVHALMAEISLPERLALPERFGRVSWSVRGLYEANAGWFDGRPESLYPLSPAAAAAELAALAGAGAVTERARALLAGGDAVRALYLTEAALAAEPGHTGALEVRLAALRSLLAGSCNYFERGFLRAAIRQTETARSRSGTPSPGK
jgi:alkyl sulfatase BDS1-like metallo-beta-lactamase superfamily hydrolase